MNTQPNSAFHPAHVLGILRRYPRRWLVPTAVAAVASVVFVVAFPSPWQASQALIVRNEATNSGEEPGQFNHADQMKTVQETIIEVAKSRGVLEAALVEVGPPSNYRKSSDAWPAASDVEDLREAVELAPPKGTEFGTTEVFYLKVKDRNRDRAVALAQAVCDQLEIRSKEIRDAKAKSMIDELSKGVALAQADLQESTSRLSTIEKQVGVDLAELRILNDSNNGDSALQRTVGEIRAELRLVENTHHANGQLLGLLKAAQDDPGRLLATPNRLLESQPALQRLKNGLVDAQLQTAQLGGRMSDEHPLVQAAHEAEQGISRHLHSELAIAIRGLEVDIRLGAEHIDLLQSRRASAEQRLEQLAALRASYGNGVAESRHRTQLVEQAEQNLAHARASQASANAASLISRVDGPDAGTRPAGPGRAMICLMGTFGGLLAGLGILMLTVEPTVIMPPTVETTTAAPAVHEGNGHNRSGVNGSLFPSMAPMSLTQALQTITASRN